MIYLDNAATGGYKPDCIINAVCASLKNCANVGRSGHRQSVACLERVYACRRELCDFFGGYGFDRVIFTKNCTEALNIALFGTLSRGDNVVSTVAEHNSVLRPLNRLKMLGVSVKLAPLNSSGEIDLSALLNAVNGNTKAVVITLASNVTGAAPDIKRLRSAIPASTLLICDGAQACGHVPINMRELGIDALAVAGHKGMLGIQGSGVLLFSERFNPRPFSYGGTGSESYNLDMPDFYPDRLESGTVSYPAIISLAEGALYLKTRMHEHKDKTAYLTEKLISGLQKMDGIELFSRPNPYGIVAFRLAGIDSEEVAYKLSEEYSICVRGGLHCAPLMHKALDSDGLVRVSFSPFNCLAEVEMCLSAIDRIVKGF